jgi:hypothetical protein
MTHNRLSLLFLLLAAACNPAPEEEKPAQTPADKVQIEITPGSASVEMGETVQLTATVTSNNPDKKWTVSWSSSSESVATVNGDGLVTAHEIGSAFIVARCGSASASCAIVVTAGQYAGVYSVGSDPMYAWSLGGKDKVRVLSSSNWTLSCDEPWLNISPSSGTGVNADIVVSTQPNDRTGDRQAVIRFESDEGSKELTIVQHGNIFYSTTLRTRRLSHTFRFNYDTGDNITKLIVMLPYAETDQYQTIRESEYGDATLATSPDGVKYLYYAGKSNFPPSGSNIIQHDFTVDFQVLQTDFSNIIHHDIPYDTDKEWYKRYTGKSTEADGSQMVDPTHSWVVNNANALWAESGEDVVEYARRCYEFVANTFTYGIYDGDNSVNAIIGRMSGDCGNQHAIWLSLMRAKGVPARPLVMYSPDDFTHVRAEFCVAGYGWIPVDVTYHQGGGDYFGRFTDDNLVVMNHEFAFKATAGTDKFNIGLLQVVAWWFWCSGPVNADGETSLTFV